MTDTATAAGRTDSKNSISTKNSIAAKPYAYTYNRPHPSVYYVIGVFWFLILGLLWLSISISPPSVEKLTFFLVLAIVALIPPILSRRDQSTQSITTIDQFQNLTSVFCGPILGTLLGMVGISLIPWLFRYRWVALMNFTSMAMAGVGAWYTFIGLEKLVAGVLPASAPIATLLAFLATGITHSVIHGTITKLVCRASRCAPWGSKDRSSGFMMTLVDLSMTPPTALVCCLWVAYPQAGLIFACLLYPIATIFERAFRSIVTSDITHHRVLRNLVLRSQFELTPTHTLRRIARTQAVCRHIAVSLGHNPHHLGALELAVELHDIGRIAVAPEVRRRPLASARTGGELAHAHLRYHINGYRALDNVSTVPQSVRTIISHHHDRYDGLSPGQTCRGADIPLDARILHTANTFIALTTPSPHYQHLSGREALAYMNTHLSGSQLCPRTIAALAQSFRESLPWAAPVVHPAPAPDQRPDAVSFTSDLTAAQAVHDTEPAPELSLWMQGRISAHDEVYRRAFTPEHDLLPPYAHDSWLEHDLPEVSALLAAQPAAHLRLPESTHPSGTFDTAPFGYLMLENHSDPQPPPSHSPDATAPLAAGAPSTPPLPANPYRPRVKRFRIRPTQ